jgi:pimeloyl-ACP methyl ester carboxylesterase
MQDWPDPELWTDIQDRLATLSDDAVHVIATEAGHVIHQDAPALVAKAVEDVREAVESGEPLECHADEWAAVGGECQES